MSTALAAPGSTAGAPDTSVGMATAPLTGLPVATCELESLFAHLFCARDREEVGHAASPRVTTSR